MPSQTTTKGACPNSSARARISSGAQYCLAAATAITPWWEPV